MPAAERPRIVAFASGKGGSGKSLTAANVGIFLATLGRRVILVDAALGTPTLHLYAGVPRPSRTLSELFRRGGPPLAELSVPTTIPGLRLIGAAGDPEQSGAPEARHVDRLTAELATLPADWVVVDLSSGCHPTTIELFNAADVRVLIATPEPSSIELMHRFVRAGFLAHARDRGLGGLLDAVPAEDRADASGMPSALEVYEFAVASGDSKEPLLRRAILDYAPQLVMNAVRSKSDMEVGRALVSVGRRRLGLPLQYLGHQEYDEAVWASTRRRRPLLIEHPETRIAKCFERVARGLHGVRPLADRAIVPSDNHYDLLDVAPTASFEDIRRANRRIRDIYGADSIVISGLYDPVSLEAVHRRLDVAYAMLMDAGKRKEYDQGLFPDGIPVAAGAPLAGNDGVPRARVDTRPDLVAQAPTRSNAPEVGPRTEFSGPLLRQLREAAGIELRDIAERSKIGMGFLTALEGELFGKLPAPVYVRGFLAEYARILSLPAERVKESYLARYRAARGTADDDEAGARRR